MKEVELTSGGQRCVPESGLKEPQGFLIGAQESAKGIAVDHFNSRKEKYSHSLIREIESSHQTEFYVL